MEHQNATIYPTALERRTPDGGEIELDKRRPLMRVDLTINLPTIITILVLIVTTGAFGVGLYSSLDKRQMSTEFEIIKLSQRIEENRINVGILKNEQTVQTSNLRSEMKNDIGEIKDLLNRIIFSGPTVRSRPQKELNKEWSR